MVMLDPFLIDVDEVTNAQFATLLNALAVTARRFVRASELRPDDVEGSAANRLWRGQRRAQVQCWAVHWVPA